MDGQKDQRKMCAAALTNAQLWSWMYYPSIAKLFGILSKAFRELDDKTLREIDAQIKTLPAVTKETVPMTGQGQEPNERCEVCGTLHARVPGRVCFGGAKTI